MDDTLLTIDDATREFRVSPKTIRRRLAAGEIEGAYKRPGPRGPEWVFTRGALAATGAVPRDAAAEPKTLPEDPDDRAEYWERRARDAEAALATPSHRPLPPPAPRDWRWVRPVALVALLLALVAGALVLGGGDRQEAAPDPARAVLVQLTDPGDAVGVVGVQGSMSLPAERVPVVVDDLDDLDDLPPSTRYVLVTTGSSDADPAVVEALEASHPAVLRLASPAGAVRLHDRAAADGDGAASETAAPTTSPEPEPDPGPAVEFDPSTTVAPAGPDATAVSPAPPPDDAAAPTTTDVGVTPPADEGPGSPPPTTDAGVAPEADDPSGSPAPDTVEDPSRRTVAAGEHFWQIAADQVAAAGGTPTDAEVTGYWNQLVEANADVLVEPGNPDLLHVGQVLTLPPVG